MVQSSAADVDTYLAEVPPERQPALRRLRDLVRSMLRMTAATPGKIC